MREVPVGQFCLNMTNVNDGKVTTVELDINSVVPNILNVTKPMCEGTYSINYSIQIQDKVFYDSINGTLDVNDGILCSSSTTSPSTTPMPTPPGSAHYMHVHVQYVILTCDYFM